MTGSVRKRKRWDDALADDSQATLGAWTLEGRIQAIQQRGREALEAQEVSVDAD